MRIFLWVIALISAGIISSAQAEEPAAQAAAYQWAAKVKPPRNTNYPGDASLYGYFGLASLDCRVADDKANVACSVIVSGPNRKGSSKGYGFDKVAVKYVQSNFHLISPDGTAAPIGARNRFDVTFGLEYERMKEEGQTGFKTLPGQSQIQEAYLATPLVKGKSALVLVICNIKDAEGHLLCDQSISTAHGSDFEAVARNLMETYALAAHYQIYVENGDGSRSKHPVPYEVDGRRQVFIRFDPVDGVSEIRSTYEIEGIIDMPEVLEFPPAGGGGALIKRATRK